MFCLLLYLSVSSDCWQCTINRLLTGQLGLFPGCNLDKRDSVLIDPHSPHNDLCVPLCANRPLTCTVDHYICCIEPALNTSHHVHASSSWDELSILKIVYEADHYEQMVIVIVSASHVNLVKWQRNCDWEECDEPKAKVLFKKSLFIFVPWLNLYIYIYIYISGVKQLIMINHIQNKSFCLHNIWVLCIFIMYI